MCPAAERGARRAGRQRRAPHALPSSPHARRYTGEDDITSHRSRAALPPAQADEAYTQSIPDLDEYSKEPPPLPPHLRHIILNKAPVVSDACALPVPHHVALNHLYCTAIKARARARARAHAERERRRSAGASFLTRSFASATPQDGVMVLGITQRHRQKSATTVYYSMMN